VQAEVAEVQVAATAEAEAVAAVEVPPAGRPPWPVGEATRRGVAGAVETE
jgi:hypothetical protein